MAVKWDQIRLRATSSDTEGRLRSLVDGSETDAELREIAQNFAGHCPNGMSHPHCPFQLLGGLSHASVSNLLRQMKRQELESLFEMEQDCRNRADAQSGPQGK